MSKADFVYVTYIATTVEKAWRAMVDEDMMRQYWMSPLENDPAHINVSDWKPGSQWEHQRDDESRTVDITGKVVECEPPHRLVLTWARPADAENDAMHSRVTVDIEPHGDTLIRLTVSHEDLDAKMFAGVSDGWPKILSNLKTFLETGEALSRYAS